MNQKDKCFALNEYDRCDALTVGKCPGYEGCSFYKTEEQHVKSRKEAETRYGNKVMPERR